MQPQPVEIEVMGQKIRGNFYVPDESKKPEFSLVLLHGWTGRPNDKAAQLLAVNGYAALAINMRGHGDSDGDIQQITAADSLADAEAAYDYLKAKFPESKIVAVGNSYGSYIAILLSERRQVAALSLRVPATYPDDLYGLPKWGRGHDDANVAAWRRKEVGYADNRGFQLLHNFLGQVQIIEAELDDLVPRQAVQNCINAVNYPRRLDYHLMKGWPHSLGDDPVRNAEFQRILLNWTNSLKTGV